MSHAPSAEDLLRVATAQIRETAAGLDPQARYQLLLAARAAEIALRDRAVAQALKDAQAELAGLADSRAIRDGACDGDRGAYAALMRLTALGAYATRPDILDDDEMNMVTASI